MLRRCLISVFLCLAIFSVFGGVIWLIDRSSTLVWVGATDLSVEFFIADARTGEPISNARINIINEGGFYDGADEDHKAPFDIQTNMDGIATRLLRNQRCIGSESRLRFSDTYRVYRPVWNLRVFANGYETSERINIWSEYPCKMERVGVGKDKMIVRIELNKV